METKTKLQANIKRSIWAFALVVVFILAVLSAGRSIDERERNDTHMYYAHYVCLAGEESLEACDSLIGNSTDPVYLLLESILAVIAGGEGFRFLLFVISFFYIFSLIYYLSVFSPAVGLSALFLVSDFRFWEGFNNVLRHGLALSLFVFFLALGVSAKSKKAMFMRWASVLAHKSIMPVLLLKPSRRIGLVVLIGLLFSAYLVADNIQYVLEVSGLSRNHKIIYYTKDLAGVSYSGVGVPAHYVLVLFLSLLFYGGAKNQLFVLNTQVLVVLAGLAIVLSTMAMGYRMAMFMTPFVAANIAFVAGWVLSGLARGVGLIVHEKKIVVAGNCLLVIACLLVLIFDWQRVFYHL